MNKTDPLDFIPLLGFLFFGYVFLTMGKPDRLPFEEPATANQTQPIPPLCVASNPEPGVYTWEPCSTEALAESKPQVFNTIKGVWE